ncbi:MAG TPA: TagF domain-containing protein [Phycisphaerae bacterium]|jgi:hypothetical protein
MARMRGILSKLRPQRDGPAVLRAFGKLPVSREFIHVEDGEGAARAFAEWLGAGHDTWVAAHSDASAGPAAARGAMLTGRLVARLPRFESLWIVASIWPSHDQAPRQFPFTLYVVLPAAGLPVEPAGRWAACVPLWERFDQIFPELQRGDLDGVQASLREQRINSGAGDAAALLQECAAQAAGVPLKGWLAALGGEAARDPLAWLWWLQRIAEEWCSDDAQRVALAARFPLSTAHPQAPQLVSWLGWLELQCRAVARRSSLMLPVAPDAGAALSLLENPLRPDDFQLLTSDARRFAGVEDIAQPSGSMRREGFEPFVQRLSRALPLETASLRDWSELKL